MIREKKSFLYRHRIAFFLFFFTILYHCVVVNRLTLWLVSDIEYAYHVVDYSFGFCTKLLPGAVFYGIFGEKSTPELASAFNVVLLVLFFFVLSFLLERFVLCSDAEFFSAAFLIAILYLCGPFTFYIFSNELGLLDVWWLFFSIVFFIFLNHKYLKYLIPLVFCLFVLIHFSSIICYILLLSIVLLYKISNEKKHRTVYCVIFGVSLIATGMLVLYFVLFEQKNLVYSMDEFHQVLKDRNSTYYTYYDYSFYSFFDGKYYMQLDEISANTNLFSKAVYVIVTHIRFMIETVYRGKDLYNLIGDVIIITPFVFSIYHVFGLLFQRNKGNKIKRFCALLMCLQFPITLVSGCLSSSDVNRWMTHAFLISITLCLIVLYKEKQIRDMFLSRILCVKDKLYFWIYLIGYFFIGFWAYC